MEDILTAKEVYNLLISNNEIFDIYTKVEENGIKEGVWGLHNYAHVKNVTEIAEKILRDLKLDEETIYRCKIACLLHDVGCIDGKEGHPQRSYEIAKKLFEEKGWSFEGSDEVLEAIRNHSAGFETDSIVGLAIILGDKLDIKKSRITEVGEKVIGNRQYKHIEDILINIENNTLTINFITDGKMDMKEVNEFYFTPKVFKAIEAFSNRLKLKYNILMDSKIWKLDNKKDF